MPLDVVSNTDEKIPISIAPKTKGGRPAKVDGKPVLSIVSGGATAEPATDDEIAANPKLVGYLVSEDEAGASEWKVEADADLGEGVVHISEGGAYTYSAAPADNVGASAGSPVPK